MESVTQPFPRITPCSLRLRAPRQRSTSREFPCEVNALAASFSRCIDRKICDKNCTNLKMPSIVLESVAWGKDEWRSVFPGQFLSLARTRCTPKTSFLPDCDDLRFTLLRCVHIGVLRVDSVECFKQGSLAAEKQGFRFTVLGRHSV